MILLWMGCRLGGRKGHLRFVDLAQLFVRLPRSCCDISKFDSCCNDSSAFSFILERVVGMLGCLDIVVGAKRL